jgi:hypothetical protein
LKGRDKKGDDGGDDNGGDHDKIEAEIEKQILFFIPLVRKQRKQA